MLPAVRQTAEQRASAETTEGSAPATTRPDAMLRAGSLTERSDPLEEKVMGGGSDAIGGSY